MTSIARASAIASLSVILLAGLVPAVRAVDISCVCEDGDVRLSVPGLYYEAYLYRAEAPDGPYTFVAHGSFGCTSACEFLDRAVVEGETYWYQMTAMPQYGSLMYLGPARVTTPALPHRIFGSMATPNPFPRAVSVRFRIPARLALESPIDVRVKILDATGRAVREFPASPMSRGDQVVTWDGRDQGARQVPSGIYLYVIEAGAHRETGRLIKVN